MHIERWNCPINSGDNTLYVSSTDYTFQLKPSQIQVSKLQPWCHSLGRQLPILLKDTTACNLEKQNLSMRGLKDEQYNSVTHQLKNFLEQFEWMTFDQATKIWSWDTRSMLCLPRSCSKKKLPSWKIEIHNPGNIFSSPNMRLGSWIEKYDDNAADACPIESSIIVQLPA